MRAFRLYRPRPPADYLPKGIARPPEEVQLEGIEFSDGTVVVRWLTLEHSTAVFPSFEMFRQIHGHPEYGTEIEWALGPSEGARLSLV